MLPAAKALLVTVLLGGGTVGTYALAGGKFGTGGSGNGNGETTAQVSNPESTTPTTDEQSRVGDTAPVSVKAPATPRREEALEVGVEDRGSSDTLSGVGREEIPGSTDSSHSAKGGPGVESEEVVTVPQKNSQEETPSGNGQELSVPETPVVSESDAEREKTSLEGGSNEPGTDSNGKAKDEVQVEQQNSETEGRGGAKGNSASQNNQITGDSSEPNTAQDRQNVVLPNPDKGETSGTDQTGKGVASNVNAGEVQT